jgi:hypothetical protein
MLFAIFKATKKGKLKFYPSCLRHSVQFASSVESYAALRFWVAGLTMLYLFAPLPPYKTSPEKVA